MSKKLFNARKVLNNNNLQSESCNITINLSQSTMTAATSSSVRELNKKIIET